MLTNDGELARVLELPGNLDKVYRVRTHGRFTEEKFKKLKQGIVIKGIRYGPFEVEVANRQTTNTWLLIGLKSGKNREIRKAMQKLDLQVNRLKRIQYGPYVLGDVF